MTVWRRIDPPGPQPPWRVILLDRDGVVVMDRDYLADPAEVQLVPGAGAAMARAQKAGWFLVGVSNQSGLGRGFFTLEDFHAVMARLGELLHLEGAAFDGFFFCPHSPEARCSCRKPQVGMLAESGLLPGLDSRSWLVGDKLSDVELGQNLGIGSILVRTGYGDSHVAEVQERWGESVPVVADLSAAVELILARDCSGSGSLP